MADELPINRARSRLSNECENPHDSVVQYYAELLQIDNEALHLRHRIASEDLGRTGLHKWQDLKDFESEYVELEADIIDAREGVIYHEPHRFERVDAGFAGADNDFSRCKEPIVGQLNESTKGLVRTRKALTEKQNAATTRMGLTLSLAAVVISSVSILVSVLF